MTNIVHFKGLKVKIVKCDHSLSHTLFGTQQKCDKIHHGTLFLFAEWNSSLWLFSVSYSIWQAAQLNLTYIVHFSWFTEWKKSTLIILYLVLYPARSRSVAYTVHFLGLRSEIVNFGYSLSCTLFGMWQKCDIHCRFFKFTKWKKRATFFILYFIRHAAEMWHTSHFFLVNRVKNGNIGYSSLVPSAHDKMWHSS